MLIKGHLFRSAITIYLLRPASLNFDKSRALNFDGLLVIALTRFHCNYSATFSSLQCPTDYEEQAALGTRMKDTFKLATNLKQVIIRKRRLA